MTELNDRPPHLRLTGQSDGSVRVNWGRSRDMTKWDALDFWVIEPEQVISIGQLIELITEAANP